MKTLKFLAFAAFAVCLAACGGDKTYDVKVDNTTIGGKLSQYFTLVDKTYKYDYNDGCYDNVTVELQCIQPLPEDLTAYIGIDVLDKDGTVISSCNASWDSFENCEALRQASPGEIVTVEITNTNTKEFSKPAKIRLSSVVEEVKESTYSSSSSSSSCDSSSSSDVVDDADDSDVEEVAESSSSSSSEDFDAALDSYEKYVDKYIALLKKASKGDMTAMAEYPSLMQQAQECGDKLSSAKGDLTASQMARYTKIQMKMLKAAQEIK